ncbi:MAG: RNA chaperone Hfq [Terracidiphilus sp.]|nr:RNA chaperone Hfq [Terracidiphilus sp.]
MDSSPIPIEVGEALEQEPRKPRTPIRRTAPEPLTLHTPSRQAEPSEQHQAELFYLQKQIQAQTPMVVVLEDGERVEGIIEWYDRDSIKLRGRSRMLIYKSAIKYMYKVGENIRQS